MAIFSSCCCLNDSDDDHSTANPRSSAIPAGREPADFRTVRYDQTRLQTPPYTDADAASNATTRSSQLSPHATPSRRREPDNGLTASAVQQDAPKTPVKDYGTTQDVSPSVYSQPSQPRTPPSAGTVQCVGRQEDGGEAVGRANAEQTAEPSMDEIRKFMGDEKRKK